MRARASEVAKEAVSYPGYNAERLRARVEEKRYALSGGALLVAGFTLQLTAYAWMFSSWWMIGYAVAVAFGAGLLALFGAKRLSARFYERADKLMRDIVK
jgi:hypothetical protein